MGKNIGVDPEKIFGLLTDINAKMKVALRNKDLLSVLNLEACLKANEEQKIANIKSVLRINYPDYDKRFGGLLVEGEFTVGSIYNHQMQMAIFYDQYKTQFTHISVPLEDANFVTDRLEPGQTYTWGLYPVLLPASTKNCMAFLKKKKSLMIGAPGLSIFYDLCRSKFPHPIMIVSFGRQDYFKTVGIEFTKNCEQNFLVGFSIEKTIAKNIRPIGYFCLLCVNKKNPN